MRRLFEDLREHARGLQRQARRGEAAAVERVRALPELRALSCDELPAVIKRRHCLAVIARELGFQGWPHLVAVIEGKQSEDFGTLLYEHGHWNIWSASYQEARSIRSDHGGYLLPYKRQFVIVDRYFIETLGLDPDDADWTLIGRDFVQPGSLEARARLYSRRISQRLHGSASAPAPSEHG